jgi:thiol-disulfide isomerase/thioredoxin
MPCPRARLALAVTLCATAAFAQPRADATGPVEGDVAPRVVIRLVDGRLLDTSTLAGRAYVLDFWHPSCGPCRGYVPRLNAAHRRLARTGAMVIGVLAGPSDGVDHARLRRAWGIR